MDVGVGCGRRVKAVRLHPEGLLPRRGGHGQADGRHLDRCHGGRTHHLDALDLQPEVAQHGPATVDRCVRCRRQLVEVETVGCGENHVANHLDVCRRRAELVHQHGGRRQIDGASTGCDQGGVDRCVDGDVPDVGQPRAGHVDGVAPGHGRDGGGKQAGRGYGISEHAGRRQAQPFLAGQRVLGGHERERAIGGWDLKDVLVVGLHTGANILVVAVGVEIAHDHHLSTVSGVGQAVAQTDGVSPVARQDHGGSIHGQRPGHGDLTAQVAGRHGQHVLIAVGLDGERAGGGGRRQRERDIRTGSASPEPLLLVVSQGREHGPGFTGASKLHRLRNNQARARGRGETMGVQDIRRKNSRHQQLALPRRRDAHDRDCIRPLHEHELIIGRRDHGPLVLSCVQ